MKKIISMLMAVSLSMMVFAGCSSEPNEETPNTPDDPGVETPEEEPVELKKLSIAYMPNYASLNTVVAGMRMGYFEEQGFDIELVEFADGPTIIAAMESGSIDLGYIGPGAHKLAIEGRTKIFAISHFGNADEVIANTDKGIKTIEDLKGKTIAMASGTTSEMILDMTLKDAGLTKDDVVIMDMDPSAIVTAMISGSVDAAATWSPNTFTIKEDMGDKAMMLTNNATYVETLPSIASWIVNPGYAEENADTVLKFTKALYKAMDYRTENVEEVCKWVAEEAKLDEASVLDQRGDGEWITSEWLKESLDNGRLVSVYQAQQDNFIESGAVETEAPVKDYVMLDNMQEAFE
ncbi:aliphatic sulfonate ABC transporter substrate-binding protein [Proteiniclasticum sp. C24MP]|uniref:aliphatic sulfonate ABC transporter substrate-binding protein n=1 Tax=Proteiniclasticum sp. C24MP TaxID=3374101 RepID=UPI003754EBC0